MKIDRIAYCGWRDAWRLSNDILEAIVVADVGPRILHFGLCGQENVLHEVEADRGRSGGNEFRLYGGHRLWAWPEVARTYFPDNRPVCVAELHGRLRFTSPVEDSKPGTGLRKEIEIEIPQDGNRMRVLHRITNSGAEPTELAVWCPTMMRASGRAILPLPPRAPMDAEHFQSVGPLTLWSFTDLADARWILGTEFLQLRQEKEPRGRFAEQMTGIFNPAGWVAYHTSGMLFVKRAAPLPGASYPDFGCNFEVFTNRNFLEVETLGPKLQLQPQSSAIHEEHWGLFADVPEGADESWIKTEIVPRAASMA